MSIFFLGPEVFTLTGFYCISLLLINIMSFVCVPRQEYVHVAGTKLDSQGAWHFARSNVTLTYFHWASHQPGDDDCVALNPGNWPLSPGMNDVACRHQDWGRFVCELAL